MPLTPSPSWGLVRVFGTWHNLPDGSMKDGKFKVTVPVRVTNATDGVMIPAGIYSQGTLQTASASTPSLDVLVPSNDDPDNLEVGWQVTVEVSFADGSVTEKYVINTPLAARPVADGGTGVGVDLAKIAVASGFPTQVAMYPVGVAGGLAKLNTDGQVVDADGLPVAGGEGGGASPAVLSVAGKVGVVSLVKGDVGLSSVDNTSDVSKPVSTATQAALNAKAPTASPTFTGTVSGVTKAHVGLGNVDNTSDLNKPVSTATQAAIDAAATGSYGVVQVDSFPGASDAAKMSAALTYAAAQTRVPWLQLPPRVFNTGSTTYSLFTGCKIMGPGRNSGPQNEEIASGKGVVGKWQTTCGSGASSLLQATGTVYDVNISGIVFHGASGSQIFRSTVNSYACSFDNLTFYGCKHAFGSTAEKWLGTQFLFTGHWTALSYTDTQFILGGGDASLWMGGYLNSNSPSVTAGAGRPIIDLQGVGKTNVGDLYLTCENDWTGLRISGNPDKGISFFGGQFEGRSQSNLATRPVIDIQGGTNYFYGPWVAQVSSSVGTVSGAVHQSGGTAYFYGGTYHRGAATTAAFPFLYQTGGVARFHGAPVSVAGEQIRIRWSSGTTDTVAAPANGVVV